jgi:hypothetical protein
MEDKEEVGGQHPSSGLKMEGGHRVRPGTSFIPCTRASHVLIKSSSLRSNSSKKIPPLSLPAAQKKKPAESVGVNRAIPGPGDEIEAEPDAGVLDTEKVTVVFLVSYLVAGSRGKLTCSASKSLTTHLFQLHTTDAQLRVLKLPESIRS